MCLEQNAEEDFGSDTDAIPFKSSTTATAVDAGGSF